MPDIPTTPQGSALPPIPPTWRSLIPPVIIIVLVILGAFSILLLASGGEKSFSWNDIQGQQLSEKEIAMHTTRCVEHYSFLGEGALESGRNDLCRSVQDTDARISCEAQALGSAARCDAIIDAAERALCKARSGEETEACGILSGDDKLMCEVLAIENYEMCSNIVGEFSRNRCFDALSHIADANTLDREAVSLSMACENEIRRIVLT